MIKTFSLRYYTEENQDEEPGLPYPTSTVVTAEYTFDDMVTWDVILWQFCKFLEASGYEGVKERVQIQDPFGIMKSNCLFECVGGDMEYEYDSEEDEEEEDTEEENLEEEK
jgi:hypothetical protein